MRNRLTHGSADPAAEAATAEQQVRHEAEETPVDVCGSAHGTSPTWVEAPG